MNIVLNRLTKAYDICQKAGEHDIAKIEIEQQNQKIEESIDNQIKKGVLFDTLVVLVGTGLFYFGRLGALVYLVVVSLITLAIIAHLFLDFYEKKARIRKNEEIIDLEKRESERIISEHEKELSFLPQEFRNSEAIIYMLHIIKEDEGYSMESIFRMCKRYMYSLKCQNICHTRNSHISKIWI